MARSFLIARIVPSSRRKTARCLAGSVFCALALVGSCGLAGAASSATSGAKISAHLTKTSLKRSQAGSASAGSSQTAVVSRATEGAGASRVSTGGPHTCALLSDGTVKCWGYNKYGELGNSTTTTSPTPVTVSVITNASQVSVGGWDTCALLPDHTIKCWGINAEGQLGDGVSDHDSKAGGYDISLTPVTVSGITNATQVSAGSYHTCALLSDHTIQCWGANEYGQLGDGVANHGSKGSAGRDISPTPVTVNGITNATQVSAGSGHTCALVSDQTVKCWGDNSSGELGDGTTTNSSTPVTVSGISNATQLSSTGSHTCALLSNQTVKCWGANSFGQLGDGVISHGHGDGDGYDFSPTPVQVSGITNAAQVSAGWEHTCAVLSDHTIKCWGDIAYGELGNGATTTSGANSASPTPVTVSVITNASQVSAGGWHTCALLSDQTVKCWGDRGNGKLGDGIDNSRKPVTERGITSAIQVSAGSRHTCALLSNHTVRCWGNNAEGQLGDGVADHGSRNSYQEDMSLAPVMASGITNATQVSAGNLSTCALLSNHTVRCWGYNFAGLLGNGTTRNSRKPVTVSGITNATEVSAHGYNTCALLSNHTVKCWGYNLWGQLGNGTTRNSLKPSKVSGITNATQVSTSGWDTCALLSNHTIKCWGYNTSGQLGNGTTRNSRKPATVSGITNATQVIAGSSHTCALLSNHTIKCWGYNYYRQLGNGTTRNSRKPVKVSGITNATQVSLGWRYSCALLSNHKIKCWGDNRGGQLGSATPISFELTPVKVNGVTHATQVSAGWRHTCALLSNSTVKCWGTSEWTPYATTPVSVIGIP